MSKTKTNIPLIQPLVKVEGQKHIFEEMIADQSIAEMKAVGYAKINDGASNWVSYVITFKGGQVISMVVGEPNLRSIAEETAKIDFVNEFMDVE